MVSETIRVNYDIHVAMQLELRNLRQRVAAFESGAAYQRMETANHRIRHYYEGQLQLLKRELDAACRETVKIRNMWFDVFLEVQKEYEQRIRELEKQFEQKDALILKGKQTEARLREEVRDKTHEVVEERTEKIREKEKNQALKARLSENSANSSTPSSQESFRGKVPNNREKSGKAPGAQPGHEGHKRKRFSHVDHTVRLKTPAEITENPDYYPVMKDGKPVQVHKKVVDIHVDVIVTDYVADVYRNRKNGARKHAAFPDGMHLEVNYGDSVKALVFFMRNHMNVSEEKIIGFLREVTDGELEISRGMVDSINREFSEKTGPEQEAIFAALADASVLYADMTNVRMNGQLKNVVACSDHRHCMYTYRDHKGDEGLKGTPIEVNDNVHVHDHDRTMYHYGSRHQECNEHHLRYLKGAMENEPGFTWHMQMRELLQEMNRTREAQGRNLKEEQIQDFEERYDRILDLADKEYYDNPPTDYYRKGFNLSREFREYRESILYFLHDPEVDFTNNEAERCCRQIKRRMAVSGTFRGKTEHSAQEYCAAMSVLQTWRMAGERTLTKITEVFSRPRPDRTKAKESDAASA